MPPEGTARVRLPAYLELSSGREDARCTVDVCDFKTAALAHLGWMRDTAVFKTAEEPLLENALRDCIARCSAATTLEGVVASFSDEEGSSCFRARPFAVETHEPPPLSPLSRSTSHRRYGKWAQVNHDSVVIAFHEENPTAGALRWLVEFLAVLVLHRFFPSSQVSLPAVIYADTFHAAVSYTHLTLPTKA